MTATVIRPLLLLLDLISGARIYQTRDLSVALSPVILLQKIRPVREPVGRQEV